VAYNLQYTRSLVSDLVEENPPAAADSQVLAFGGRELVRVNLYGQHPSGASRRVCVIGIGDDQNRAEKAATDAWFDYHASVLFAGPLRDEGVHTVPIRHPVPGTPAQRAATVGWDTSSTI
jgi:hypothetical protein